MPDDEQEPQLRRRRGPGWWKLRSGIPEDFRGRLRWYKDDWVEGWNSGYR